jgi:hypothetical protein
VFRILDLLLQIRIPEKHHWNTNLDPALFFSVFQDANYNQVFLLITILNAGTFTSVSKDKNSQNYGEQGFPLFVACLWKISGHGSGARSGSEKLGKEPAMNAH